MPPVHLPSFRLPDISLPSFADIKAKFAAFKGKVSSALQSIGRRTATPVTPLQNRQVETVNAPAPSAIQGLKNHLEPDALKQKLIAQHPTFEAKVHKNDTSVDALPKALTGSPEFKDIMGEFSRVLGAKGSWDVKADFLANKYAPQLNQLINQKAPPGTKLALTLDDGRAFIESLKKPILEHTSPDSKAAVEREFNKMMNGDTWQKVYDNATKNLGGTAEGFGDAPENATLTFGQDKYQYAKELGSGAFGAVYLFKKDPKNDNEPGLVVKVPKQGGMAYDHKRMIEAPAAEGRSMANAIGTGASAENILPLQNAIRTPTGELLLVLGMAKNGSVESAKNKIDASVANKQLDWASAAQLKLTLMVDLAKGLERLQLAKGQAHLDVATRNMLIKENGSTVLADFGLTEEYEGKIVAEAKLAPTTDRTIMPTRWTAPERLKLQAATNSADTWSFGMTLVEVVYGKVPFPQLTNSQFAAMVTAPDFDPEKALPEISKEQWPDGLDAQLRDLLVKTLQTDPAKRPSMDEILKHPALNSGITGTPAAKQLLADVLNGKPVPPNATGANATQTVPSHSGLPDGYGNAVPVNTLPVDTGPGPYNIEAENNPALTVNNVGPGPDEQNGQIDFYQNVETAPSQTGTPAERRYGVPVPVQNLATEDVTTQAVPPPASQGENYNTP